jgi:adenylylsulfate reductase subunit A
MDLRIKMVSTDFLIIGGGAAGCYAALTFCEHSKARVIVAEKADIMRSGCLAAGVNAINAYIAPGKTPMDYVEYALRDAEGIVRKDLLLSMAEGLNRTVRKLESLGLSILKDANGKYAARGWRNIKINGENIKPLLARAVGLEPQITVLERVNVFDYMVKDNKAYGAYAISVTSPILYAITAKAVLCATGGAAGLYKPNHPGFSRHKLWYPPFNTGAGYAMGIRAGAEMTAFEMRFIALRCKDTIAPTGTLAQGVDAKQINALGEEYGYRYGSTTSQRVYGTVAENLARRGPCFLKTVGISKEQEDDLLKAYLNMAPSQTLRWIESGLEPSDHNVEIEGTEPYIVGGHTSSGYWVDTNRETTIEGLFAAGDVAGGCPQKYVSGALVEGEIAAKSAIGYMNSAIIPPDQEETGMHRIFLEGFLTRSASPFSTDELEEAMQAVMDAYAGGISTNYRYSKQSLDVAAVKIHAVEQQAKGLSAAKDMQELVYILELRERLTLCRSVIAHLDARKETRWRCFAEHADYPGKSAQWECHVNSRTKNDKLDIILRPLEENRYVYEHRD